MHAVPKTPIISVVIDAACVHKVADRVLAVVRNYAPPDTLGGSYMLRGMVRQSVFWLPIIAAMPGLIRRLGIPAEQLVGVRTFVFDALYSPGASGLVATAGEHKLNDPERLAREAAERSFVYWMVPTPLFGVPDNGKDGTVEPGLGSGTLHTPEGDVDFSFSVPLRDQHIHAGAANYDRPGLYLGYLSADDRSGLTQKQVDTMMALCMLLESQQGNSVVFYGQDTDLIPALQLAARHRPAAVCALERVPLRWHKMQMYEPKLLTEELPVTVPVFRSWTDAEREQAVTAVAQELCIPRDRVKAIDFKTPTVADVDFVKMWREYEPERVQIQEQVRSLVDN